MEKPYRELAQLVGRVLAKRWLNKTAKQDTRPNQSSKPPKADSCDEPPADASEVGSSASV